MKNPSNPIDNVPYQSGVIFNKRLTWKQKKKDDFKWIEKCADHIDRIYLPYSDKTRLKRLQMNYDLYNGHGEKEMQEYAGQIDDLFEEGVFSGYENVQHHPIINQVAKSMVGEQQLRPLNPTAWDTSIFSMNDRKRKKQELYTNWMQVNILDPIKQKITMQVMQEMGITDPYKMTPDEQEQFARSIEGGVKANTPKEIEEYMRKGYKSPSETQAQKLIDFLMDYLDIKFLTDEGFKHAIITGEEIYKVGIRHNMPSLELVNPMGFYHLSRGNAMFIEDGIAAKYDQYVMLNDIYNWHGDEIGKSKEIQDKLEKYSLGLWDTKGGAPNSRLVAEVVANPAIAQNAPYAGSREGQEYLKNIFESMGQGYHRGGDIKYTHITFKALRKLKQIKRSTDGQKRSFWVDESYQFNSLKGDLEEYECWVPEVWEATKIGYSDAIYLNKQPIPYQYRSLDNPFDVKLCYVGALYSKLMGNSSNVAPMDLGKPWQYKFNIQMAKIHELEATDMGKVFLTSFQAKPKDWSWKKFILMMKYGKIAPVDMQQEGVTPVDAQLFKSLDLSTMSELEAKLQYLEFLKNQIVLSMSYNPSRLGMQAPNVSVTNNQQNIMQSSYQTYDIYNLHQKVVENLLNILVNTTRVAFKEDSPTKGFVMDDMSIAELDLDWEMLWRSELAIKIRDSNQDFENILQLRQLAQPLIQNGLISFSDAARLQFAKNGAEIMNIVESSEEKIAKMKQEERDAQQQQLQQQAQMEQQIKQMEQAFQEHMQDAKLQNEILVAEIAATRFANQLDVDKDMISDKIQERLLENQQQDKELENQNKENEKDRQLEIYKEKVKEKIAKIKATQKPAVKKK